MTISEHSHSLHHTGGCTCAHILGPWGKAFKQQTDSGTEHVDHLYMAALENKVLGTFTHKADTPEADKRTPMPILADHLLAWLHALELLV